MPPTQTGLPGAAIQVLAVDDDKFMRQLLQRVLSAAGMRVSTCGSADELLRAPALATCSLLLLDVKLPGLSGLDLHQRLKQQGFSRPVVFISGAADLALAVSAMRNGAADFIEKPFKAALLVERLRRVVARHQDDVARAHEAQQPDHTAPADQTAPADRTTGAVRLGPTQAHTQARAHVHAHVCAEVRAQVHARFATLTPREREVFALLVTGLSSKQMARELGGSFRTIEVHRAQVMHKMAARHLPELVRMSIECLEPPSPPLR